MSPKMKTAPDSPLTVWLDECAYGWISLHVRTGEAELRLSCTNWDDPFPGIVRWAKRLLAGSPREVARINEEGRYAHLVATATAAGSALDFTVHRTPEYRDPLPPPLLSWHGPREVLAATIYRAFRDFAASPAYDPRDWAGLTIADWLVLTDPTGQPLSALIEFLVHWPREGVMRRIRTDCRHYTKQLAPPLPRTWNRLAVSERRRLLLRLLRHRDDGWLGYDLLWLRCRALEELCYGAMRTLPDRLRRLRR